MTSKFMVINYSSNSVIQDLGLDAVLVTLRVLMTTKLPSFDVVELIHSDKKKFVTHEFEQMKDGRWQYCPCHEAKAEE